MKEFHVRISCDSDAFYEDTCAEIARILRKLAKTVETGMIVDAMHEALRDINGNSVGTVDYYS